MDDFVVAGDGKNIEVEFRGTVDQLFCGVSDVVNGIAFDVEVEVCFEHGWIFGKEGYKVFGGGG